MADKKSEKSCYQSQYGGGWITVSAMLAEMSCERMAGVNTLGARFWQNPQWKTVFAREMIQANKLLLTFDVKAIVAAWNSKGAKKVQHLGVPFFKPYIEAEQLKLVQEVKRLETAPKPENVNTFEKPRPMKRVKKSIRERLADSDNGQTKGSLFDTNEN